MIDLLRNIVAEYITNNADMDNWESIREQYGIYSYLTFLCIAAKSFDIVNCTNDVMNTAITHQLEERPNLDTLLASGPITSFIDSVLDLLKTAPMLEIEQLYQEYLSVDFQIKDSHIIFENGKNSRDILGSYYTQKSFAETITKLAIEDYFKQNNATTRISIADFSCGGSTFLMAALNFCYENHIDADLYGYDVDPIAVLISKVKTQKANKTNQISIQIQLGNPLLPGLENNIEKFKMSLAGRFYNAKMGITPVNNIDVVLGNPPWEKVRFEEKKFLQHFLSDFALDTKEARIKTLQKSSRNNIEYYNALSRDYEKSKLFFKKAPQFAYSSHGEINTYALFTELSYNSLKPIGIAYLIIKSSLLKTPVYQDFFRKLTFHSELYKIYMFTNRKKIFNIDSREEFSVICFSKHHNSSLSVTLDLDDFIDMEKKEKINLSYKDLSLVNPETCMIPSLKSGKDLEFLLALSKSFPSFATTYHNCHFGRLVHLTNHSKHIHKQHIQGNIPIYEGKFIELYTGKYATFAGMVENEKYRNKSSAYQISNPQGNEYPESRFFIEENTWKEISKNFNGEYILAWRSLTSSTNRRTMLATILPFIPTCQSIQILQLDNERQMLHLLALFNSIVFDYIVRLKMAGLDLTQTIIKQIPVPQIEQYDKVMTFNNIEATISKHIISRLKALYLDDKRVASLFTKYDTYTITKDRKAIIAELDHLIGFLYGLDNKALSQIASSFDSFYTKNDIHNYFQI